LTGDIICSHLFSHVKYTHIVLLESAAVRCAHSGEVGHQRRLSRPMRLPLYSGTVWGCRRHTSVSSNRGVKLLRITGGAGGPGAHRPGCCLALWPGSQSLLFLCPGSCGSSCLLLQIHQQALDEDVNVVQEGDFVLDPDCLLPFLDA